jgi:phage gp29-like protein
MGDLMAKSAILDQWGRPFDKAAMVSEVAGPSLTGVRSPIAGYPGDGLNPGRLAAILREADEGEPLRFFELAETIEERDHHYAGVLGTRKRSVSQLDITVADDDDVDQAQADMVSAWLNRDELQGEIFDILDAIGKGWSMTEIVWDTSEGQWRPERLEWRDPRWFRPRREDGTTPLLRTDAGDVELPGFKFITAFIKAKSGLPVRSGIARVAAWSWMFKAFTMRDWAIFVQTFGQPVRVGKYGPNATEAEKDTLFRAVANIAGDCAAIIPESMAIEFIDAPQIGAAHVLYKERADWLDQQVSKLVLGQTATTDSVTGGLGSGKEHRQVQEDIERADAKALAAILNRDLIRPWIDLEYGPDTSRVYPRIKIGYAEEQDITTTVDAVEKLVPLGLRVSQKEMRELIGLAEPANDDELLVAPSQTSAVNPQAKPKDDAPKPGEQPGEKAALQASEAARDTDAADALSDAAETVVGPAANRLIDAVKAAIDGATSMDEVRQRLEALKPELPVDDLARALQLALAMAELIGRSEIADDAAAGAS